MSMEKVESGTIILDQNGAEIGVVKKIYSPKLVRLELPDSMSIAFNPTLVKDMTSSGRLLKKKTATIIPDAEIFFKGARDTLKQIIQKAIRIIIGHLETKEIKKALQHFEFDFLTQCDIQGQLHIQELVGFIRGIELAIKTPQDFMVKYIFQTCEDFPELKSKIPPEIVVDKLNQEKAFNRILWNILRFGISNTIKAKDFLAIEACCDTLFETGLKYVETEYKNIGNGNDILYWQERIEDIVFKYIALLIMSLEPEKQAEITEDIKQELNTKLKNIKIHSTIKELTQKNIEIFDLKKYEGMKTIELIHSGIKGFNLKVMSEKNAMMEILELVNKHLDDDSKKPNIISIGKDLDQYARNVRDVSKEFQNILFEIGQYFKKIEYGDSKVDDYYSNLIGKLHKKYGDLAFIVSKINEIFHK